MSSRDTETEVYENLVAGRFDEAKYLALESTRKPWLPEPIVRAIRAGDWYLAICELGNRLFPKMKTQLDYQRAMADRPSGVAYTHIM